MRATSIRAVMFILVSACLGQEVMGQIEEHRLEVGVLLTSIRLRDFKDRTSAGVTDGHSTVKGFGGRIAYNLTDHLALDGEASFFSRSHLGNRELGQKALGLAGLKVGARNSRIGIFGKARPGVMWFGDISSRGSCRVIPAGTICDVAHARSFVLDLGGVAEFYTSQRTIIRLDVGNTIIRLPEQAPGPGANARPAATTHNFQVSVGFGYRF